MIVEEFVPKKYLQPVESGSFKWQSPSNIALVKYWGKKKHQIPANPSVSFTLDHCKTLTQLDFQKKKPGSDFDFDIFFEGSKKEDFKPKINTFFKRIERYCPFLKEYSLQIHSENTFPHSSGIASSASGMSALALCLMSIEKKLNPNISAEFFIKKASFLSRLGSGSACRSIEGELVVWGKHQEIKGSSDFFGIPYPNHVHTNFKNYQDTILLVDKGRKEVSSSVGHNLMHGHPFAEARFKQAGRNLADLNSVLAEGNLEEFIKIVENEALSLHSMMMSSMPYFILMKPDTLEIINKIWDFRRQSSLPVCFTLDAGANVHVLYPEKDKYEIFEFIKNELVAYCENGQYICDQVGSGAIQLPMDN
ncbi:diphosphomevalonate/mevalonate 3,5-bisphosphate decarboxylase family protein [Autumnicola musiva]|uniref:Diphosphomevalonate decarboxylase n=1 Tax=Autumnicola musiva TaxID=3075589 RepID=A0ABU3D1L8_9FLAO|nr:diphosphomevalonate decarboxylase [Zunongwangia sp. F117]MDT0675428.1 diphosphomevalonate decarboxylase [Zunongwangia sp. F117]